MPARLRSDEIIETLSVRVSRSAGQGYSGRLSSTAHESLGTLQDVRGDRCDDVLDALGFAAALGIERMAAEAAVRADAAPGSGALVVEAARASAEPAQAVGLKTAGDDMLKISALVFAQLGSGVSPGSAFELGGALRLSWSGRTWQPLFLVGLYASAPRQARVSSAQLRFSHWSSQWIGCPWRFPQGGSFGLRPCLGLELGVSTGEAVGLADAAKYDAPWVSAATQLRGELVLGESWEIGAFVDGLIPLSRSHFYLVPNATVFDTPAFGLRFGASGALLF